MAACERDSAASYQDADSSCAGNRSRHDPPAIKTPRHAARRRKHMIPMIRTWIESFINELTIWPFARIIRKRFLEQVRI
jgi:hypothetical protein